MSLNTISRRRDLCSACEGHRWLDEYSPCGNFGGFGYIDESDESLRDRFLAAVPSERLEPGPRMPWTN